MTASPRSEPLGFLDQFGYAALLCLILAYIPRKLLHLSVHLQPGFFAHHRHIHTLLAYAAHSCGLFLVIIAAFILLCAVHHHRGLSRLHSNKH